MKSRYFALESPSLWSGVKHARAEERRVLTDLLHYLLEIERRQAHLLWGYSSLFTFLTEGLGYDPSSAHRRKEALQALKDTPEIEPKLKTGALALSTVCQVRQLIREEEKTRSVSFEEKRELLALVEHRSQTEAERILMDARPEAMRLISERRAQASRSRPLPESRREIHVVIPESLFSKWERLKDLRSQAL
jgi:hypothetical protein